MGKIRVKNISSLGNNTNSPNITASNFELRVKKLLKNLGFTKIEGGPTFKIGGKQIDACGLCENNIVIFECTTQRKNLGDKISEFKGEMHQIKRGLDSLDDYRKYNCKNNLAFVLASQSSNINLYENTPSHDKLVLLDSDKITYYETLAKAIPSRAKYDFLSDLDFSMNTEETIKIPAFRIKYDDIEMFNFFINPDDLIKISYVARRESQRQDFYQRMIEVNRLKDITKFLETGGIFPTNIVIAINKKCDFKKISNNNEVKEFPNWLQVGFLEFPKEYNSCWIIDGQHRLYSFKKGMPQKLSVLAFNKPTLNKQTNYFVEINRNAKPIKSDLIWDLEGDLRPNKTEGIISNSVKSINKHDPFTNKINIPSIGKGPINLTTFCTALMKSQIAIPKEHIKTGIGKTLLKNPLYNPDYLIHIENISKAIIFYFDILYSQVSPQKKYIKDFILENSGVSVFTRLYRILICLEEKKLTEAEFMKYIIPLLDYLEKKDENYINLKKRQCSSEAGITDALNEFLKQLVVINPKVSQYINVKTDLVKKSIEFEVCLKNLICKKFIENKLNILTIQKNLPVIFQNTQNKAKKQIDNISDFCNFLALGEIKDIILRFWKDIFSPLFIKGKNYINIDEQFPSDDIFKAKLDLTIRVRNYLIHPKDSALTNEDIDEVEQFIDRTVNIVDQL